MRMIREDLRAEGGITVTEREKLSKVSEKFIKNAFQTGRCDRKKLTKAIEELYAVSGLKKPRVVIVDNPLVMALSYGLAATWWERCR